MMFNYKYIYSWGVLINVNLIKFYWYEGINELGWI